MLDLDISIFFIMFLVWFLMSILNKIYYKPVGNLIGERESKIKKDSEQIEALSNEIEEKTQKITR